MLRRAFLSAGTMLLLATLAAAADNPAPVVIDDCEALPASQQVWKLDGVTPELSDEHATGGKHSLKLTYSKDGGAMFFGTKAQPLDWSKYKSVGFDVYNAQDEMLILTLRIDDLEATGYKDRFEPSEDLFLPPQKLTHVEIDLTNIWANNGRLMDTAKIILFNVHVGKAAKERTLYFDSFRYLPLPEKDWPQPVPPAEAPKAIDDFKAADKSAELWKASTVKFEAAAEHAPEGGKSLKLAVPAGGGALRLSAKDKPMDWRPWPSLRFEAYNDSAKDMKLTLTLEDANTIDQNSRFTVDEIALPAGKATPVAINLLRPASRCGRKMDKAKMTVLNLSFDSGGADGAVYLADLRLDPAKGGKINELRPGRIPGQTPATLGKALLDDPEITPLIPIFKAIPPKKVAMCSHSASISAHWSTSGGFFDIACEAVKAVNPGFEYKGFHGGGMGAARAITEFLGPMQEYKPTDAYFLVVPDWGSFTADKKLIDGLKSVGARTFVFDAIKPWGYYGQKRNDELRAMCDKNGATFIELTTRGYGAPGCPRWTTTDGIHMVTAGHIFYAKELLKEWAKIYGPNAATQPAKP